MNPNRRKFLRNTSAMAAASPVAMSLAGIGQASAQSAGSGSDYKALVCLFLFGGNDHGNTLIPFDDASYASYKKWRGTLAYQKDTLQIGTLDPKAIADSNGAPLTGISPLSSLVLNQRADRPANASMANRKFALPPPLTALYPKFNDGKLAVMLNVGPLVEPITAGEYNNNRIGVRNGVSRVIEVPAQIGSHNDQTAYWLSNAIEGKSTTGWGGQIGDFVLDGNTQSPYTCMSLQGNSIFLAGNAALQYQISRDGPVRFAPLRDPLYGSAQCADAMGRIAAGMTATSNVFASDHATVTSRAIDMSDTLLNALNVNAVGINNTVLNTTDIGKQLSMVARLIQAGKNSLGVKRQVFFVGMGGFDTHSEMPRYHPQLMKLVGDVMAAFHDQMNTMGLANNVTTFTASEFGRQFVSNGDGSDHGWGSMHYVLGGAVKGGALYGIAPNLISTSNTVFTNEDHLFNTGFLVPTTPVDMMIAPLARWMGVTDPAQIQAVAPNLANFASRPELDFI
jgi:uncharacterized protein (DUF1501 family)